jgi:hypothetical protein
MSVFEKVSYVLSAKSGKNLFRAPLPDIPGTVMFVQYEYFA